MIKHGWEIREGFQEMYSWENHPWEMRHPIGDPERVGILHWITGEQLSKGGIVAIGWLYRILDDELPYG